MHDKTPTGSCITTCVGYVVQQHCYCYSDQALYLTFVLYIQPTLLVCNGCVAAHSLVAGNGLVAVSPFFRLSANILVSFSAYLVVV